jgi:hypothetical protein
MLNRRSFLGRMAAAAAAAVAATETDLDPERLLWVPGQKKIFIPDAPRIHKAEDVAVEQIRREFDQPRLIEPGTRIFRPDELPPVRSRDRAYSGSRYTLTTRSPNGGLLQQHFDDDWRKVGQVVHRGRGGFEAYERPATAEEVSHFDQNANADLRTGRVWSGGHPGGGKRMAQDDFLSRFKERG